MYKLDRKNKKIFEEKIIFNLFINRLLKYGESVLGPQHNEVNWMGKVRKKVIGNSYGFIFFYEI